MHHLQEFFPVRLCILQFILNGSVRIAGKRAFVIAQHTPVQYYMMVDILGFEYMTDHFEATHRFRIGPPVKIIFGYTFPNLNTPSPHFLEMEDEQFLCVRFLPVVYLFTC